MVLSRTTLQSCRANARSTVGALTAVRTNTTAAVTETTEPAVSQVAPAQPIRKSRIPLANAFGDLAIPERDTIVQQRGHSPLGMSQAEFSGRGSLSSSLMNKRAQEIARTKEQWIPKHKPGNLRSSQVKLATPPQLADRRRRGEKEFAAEGTAEGAEARANNATNARGEKAKKVVVERIVQGTDLKTLFDVSSPATHQVVPLTFSAASPSSTRTQRMLEETAGEYSRYLPQALVSTPGDTLKKLGPVGYAHLALSRVSAAPLDQRLNALAIVSNLTGVPRAITPGTNAP